MAEAHPVFDDPQVANKVADYLGDEIDLLNFIEVASGYFSKRQNKDEHYGQFMYAVTTVRGITMEIEAVKRAAKLANNTMRHAIWACNSRVNAAKERLVRLRKAYQDAIKNTRSLCFRPGCTNVETRDHRFQVCRGCAMAKYCSVECHQAHWPHHGILCESSDIDFADIDSSDIQNELGLMPWLDFTNHHVDSDSDDDDDLPDLEAPDDPPGLVPPEVSSDDLRFGFIDRTRVTGDEMVDQRRWHHAVVACSYVDLLGSRSTQDADGQEYELVD